MWEWIANLSSLSVFLAVGAVGFLFLIVSFLFGEVFEQLELGADDVSHDGPGVVSLRTISIFLTALGGLGAFANLRGYGTLVSGLTGATGGLVLAGVVVWYARFLFRQEASSHLEAEALTGQRAEVIVGIPAQGLGQVRCVLGGQIVERIARTRDGGALPPGAAVIIEAAAAEGVIVSPWRALAAGRSLFDSTTETPALADSRQRENEE